MTKLLASVIIVNWNGKHFLQTCLSSLKAQTFTDFEIILVDNGSKDGSVDFVKQYFPRVILIPLKQNAGFSQGNNIGISRSQAKYIITLNNDTEVEKDWLENLINRAEKDNVDMVASKIIYKGENENIIDSMGLKINRNGLGTSIGNGEIDEGQYDNLGEIFAPCAGAALYKRTIFKEVGLFDKHFFTYYEDLDLGWRARLAGKNCKAAPDAVVYHHHSGSSSGKKTYFLHRNKFFTLIKNMPGKLLIKYLPDIFSADFIATACSVVSGSEFLTFKAKADALKMLPMMLHQRKLIQQSRKMSDAEMEKWLAGSEPLNQLLTRKLNATRKKAA